MSRQPLCNTCNFNREKWIPVSVSNIEDIIIRRIADKNLRKNVVYNLQYLQYLNECFAQLYLTSVLYTINCKVFIIISVSIIEAILYAEIHAKGVQKKSLWKLIKRIVSNEAILYDSRTFRVENYISEKLERGKNEEMSLDQMIGIAESKKIFGFDHEVYQKLNGLRKLRNKIHIHLSELENDTDYNSYDSEKIKMTKGVLLLILTKYLNLTDREIQNYFNYLIIENKD